MHVLLTNDDGPPNESYSPYIKPFVETLSSKTDWAVTIAVPERQRSWIGKAHMIGEGVKSSYLYTSGDQSVGPSKSPNLDLRQRKEEWTEWNLLAATPASCANLGAEFIGPKRQNAPVDLVLSGPNYGRNTSAAYIMSSGTVGAAIEASVNGRKAIALSFSYTMEHHPPEHIAQGCNLALRIVEYLWNNWHKGVQLYSVNIPLFEGLNQAQLPPIRYTPILNNQWSAIFRCETQDDGAEEFFWSPDYDKCDETVYAAGPGSDAWTVMHNEVCISPMQGIFQNVDVGESTMDLTKFAYIQPSSGYVNEAWATALARHGISVATSRGSAKQPVLEYEDYDIIDFETRPSSIPVYSYCYRKALTRKNYLGRTVAYYTAKHPTSILKRAVPESFDLEVDYAEFLDDALDEAAELRHELMQNPEQLWILKPALGERAHGIRIFSGVDELQQVFDEYEQASSEDENEPMRQYVVQRLLENPFLIDGRKFHLRVYILCVGALRVFVYDQVLVLFAGTAYDATTRDLEGHLTNTCLQDPGTARIELLSQLKGVDSDAVFADICAVVGDLFKAAVGDPINFQTIQNAFEFFGLDFLVDSTQHVHLLEVNAYPDFKQTGTELKHVVQGFFNGVVDVVLGDTNNDHLHRTYSERLFGIK